MLGATLPSPWKRALMWASAASSTPTPPLTPHTDTPEHGSPWPSGQLGQCYVFQLYKRYSLINSQMPASVRNGKQIPFERPRGIVGRCWPTADSLGSFWLCCSQTHELTSTSHFSGPLSPHLKRGNNNPHPGRRRKGGFKSKSGYGN